MLPREPWARNQYAAATVVFVVFTGFAFVLPFLPLYVKQLGIRDDEKAALWSGVLIGIAPLLAGLLAPVWGRLADRHGYKRMVVRALVCYVVLQLLSSAVSNCWQLLLLRAGTGLTGGIGPLGLAMATAHSPREHTGRAVGLIQAAQILSSAVGPLFGGWLADTIGMRRTFMVAAVLCAVALLVLLRGYQDLPIASAEPEAREAEPPAAASGSFFEVLRLPFVASMLVVLFLVNFVGRSFTPILPLHLSNLGVSTGRLAGATGLLIGLYSVAAAISAAALGRASRQVSPHGLLIGSLLLGAGMVLPMGLVQSFSSLLVLAVLLGLASGGALTLSYTIGGLLVPAGRKGSAFGFFSAAALFGGAVSPSVAGVVAHWDLRGIFFVDAALFLLLGLALLGARPPDAVRHASSSSSEVA